MIRRTDEHLETYEASDTALSSVKLGLAIRLAVKNRANLSHANLSHADLSRANLSGANLYGANLYGADLSRANLSGANLYGAGLYGADLSRANLSGADLSCADLCGANLCGADLSGADLSGANLCGANGLNGYLKCIQIDQYPITYTSDALQIGCERHAISDWADFDDHRIAEMDGKDALKFWRKYKDWIFQTIELCPAKPTGYVKSEAET